MQLQKMFPAVIVAFIALTGCASSLNSTFVGVVIDNHEDARDYQRGLQEAPLVQEYLVEGYITRFLAFFDVNDLPQSVGPIRSVRPYFVDGSSPVLSGIFHVGGSPDGLEKLMQENAPTSFNAIKMDTRFEYDDDAPAPHNRFITRNEMTELLADTDAAPMELPLARGSLEGQPAARITINHYNPVHNVAYAYDPDIRAYTKEINGTEYANHPRNIVILETDVQDTGILGRLDVRMTGGGKAVIFRDGEFREARWKKDDGKFFEFADAEDAPILFSKGQVWMIVLDSLDRVKWE
ncbi:MAG: DUF3048 domain-containing protein [Candidatus Peribacteraceae bacterium]|nr:DUF3048 domain-containing protein [Candidatus Peribacteraceae bacterium]